MDPAEVPSYWMVYFNVEDVDKAFKKATEAGGREIWHRKVSQAAPSQS